MTGRKKPLVSRRKEAAAYDGVLAEVVRLIDAARRTAARSVNAVMTTTYFLIGRRIVELEQRGVALISKLESFLLELGGDFTFVGRQRRLRVGDEWFRVDLMFFHRRLRCLVIVDLKLGKFTHADAGQMHLYLNYACEHWMLPGENPPVGLILCAEKDNAVARYALDGLRNRVLAAEYRTTLPQERVLAKELQRTRKQLEVRRRRQPRRR